MAEWLSRPTVKPGNRFGRLGVRGFDPLHGRVECNTSIAAESTELSWIAEVGVPPACEKSSDCARMCLLGPFTGRKWSAPSPIGDGRKARRSSVLVAHFKDPSVV